MLTFYTDIRNPKKPILYVKFQDRKSLLHMYSVYGSKYSMVHKNVFMKCYEKIEVKLSKLLKAL